MDTDGHNYLLVECCFTSTETLGLLGTGAQDGHLASTFTQLLNSDTIINIGLLDR